MPEQQRADQHHLSPRLQDPLAACARGKLAPNVALMRVLMEARHADEVEPALVAASEAASDQGAARLDAARALWRRSPGAWQTVKSILAEADHSAHLTGAGDPGRWAAVFDRLADISPEAGTALYTLGSQELLDAATSSLIDCLRGWGLLGADRAVLDIGCGAGRTTAALAREAGAVVGIDVSDRMLAAARRRCSGLGNVLLAETSGRDLAALASDSFDLVLAVDTFPYLVLAGGDLAAIHFREARRVLKREGSLVVFNYSYGGDPAADIEAVQRHGQNAGLEAVRLGTCDLAWWDGVTYHLRRTA